MANFRAILRLLALANSEEERKLCSKAPKSCSDSSDLGGAGGLLQLLRGRLQ